jgi:ABC-type lipoprotein release transport system permease subunit
MAWKNLWRRKVRSLLTILGSAVGVAAIVAMTTFADGLANAFSVISSTGAADVTVSQKDAMLLIMSAVDDDVGRELAALRGADEVAGTVVGIMQMTSEIMTLLQGIDAEQGVTILAVTHNHEVASRTECVITLRDGRIESDVRLADPFDRDLHDFKESPLGRAIREGGELPSDVQPIAPALRGIFARV